MARQSSAKASTAVRIRSGPQITKTSLLAINSISNDVLFYTMFIRIIYWLGITACIVLIMSCFMPWAYYADLKQYFIGFYSFQNEYGRPGKFLVLVAVIALVFMLLPKLWAKRANLFLCALGVGYTIKTYILFGSCYNNYCPEKQVGIYLMLISSVVMLAATIFPELKVSGRK